MWSATLLLPAVFYPKVFAITFDLLLSSTKWQLSGMAISIRCHVVVLHALETQHIFEVGHVLLKKDCVTVNGFRIISIGCSPHIKIACNILYCHPLILQKGSCTSPVVVKKPYMYIHQRIWATYFGVLSGFQGFGRCYV